MQKYLSILTYPSANLIIPEGATRNRKYTLHPLNIHLCSMQLIIKTLFGLEDVLAKEITSLGGTQVKKLTRAVSCEGDTALLYRANHELRTALRVLVPIHVFEAKNEKSLYQGAFDFEWENHLKLNQTFAIDPVVKSEIFRHSKFASLKVKDALVDRFRSKTRRRPPVDTEDPDIRFQLHINKQTVTILLDSSGDSLHKRGYRTRGHMAPLNECLAAGILLISDWNKDIPLWDPMCGTGTFLFEAAMLGRNIAPGFMRRKYAFMQWSNFERDTWMKVKTEAKEKETSVKLEITGSDIERSAIAALEMNIADYDFIKDTSVFRANFLRENPKQDYGMLIMNPPYGERIKTEDLLALYTQIGDHLKQSFTGHEAWILSANKDALKNIGLRTSSKHTLYNGALEAKLHQYKLYKGSKKQ